MKRLLVFLEAAVELLGVRLALYHNPTRLLRSTVNVAGRPRGGVDLVSWAIAAAARYIPRCTCLVQALAARRLLARRGHPSHLHLGVAKSPGFHAHAWLEFQGTVFVGGPVAAFTPLPPVEGFPS